MLQVATSALTVDGEDLFLSAANNAKNNALLLHNFSATRVRATLDIDGETGGALADAVIVGDDADLYTGVREILAIQRVNADGSFVPLALTRTDIAIERDRYMDEVSDEDWYERRYPSDSFILDRRGCGTLVFRGRRLFIYPITIALGGPLAVSIEGYGQIADYDADTLELDEAPDFLFNEGATWMQWTILSELNYLFKIWVPRTEGNLSPPEKERDVAWRNLIVWDTYLENANSTRQR